MGRFNGDRNSRGDRGGRSFGGGRDFGRRDGGSREMFKTVCSNCGKECEVPFRPTSGKPVYCSDCFEKMGGRNSDSARPERRERPSFGRNDRPQVQQVDNSKQLNELSAKLDKIISLLTPKPEVVVTEEVVAAPVVEKNVVEKKVKTPKVKKAAKQKEVIS